MTKAASERPRRRMTLVGIAMAGMTLAASLPTRTAAAGPEAPGKPVIGATLGAAAPGHDTQEETERGQPLPPGAIEFVIPFTETGGSARWANFYARMLSEALDDPPRQVLVRYRPGGGSTLGANWFSAQAGRGADLLFGTSAQTQFSYLLGDPRAQYDYAGWRPLLASGTGGLIYGNAALARAFAADPTILREVPVRYGAVSATGLDLLALLALDLLGVQITDPFKFESRAETRRAFLDGDTDLDFQTVPAFQRQTGGRKGTRGNALMTFGTLEANGEIGRDPLLPEVPTVLEICDALPECTPDGAGWDAWRAFLIGGLAAQKMLFAPEDAPTEVIEEYEAAFAAMVAEDDFEAKAFEAIDPYPQLAGADAQTALDAITELTPEARVFVRDWLEQRYGVIIE
ncbi:tricarboxylate transporter [Profundibacterium mesophilum]|uniref:Tricarboxylate transport protein TctC n=1 Tax=Profundibacterium mesophilum KAUST100406-0324 TaxID=1037889 RepID=A0A921TBS9_9RHOB|nr:tricarboxylate transporter [Profundibacterium mesophilum]KAF0674773.1 tricarboxylate transport protein TctC [Profundibacterium mesophilum KAUST100406-0324]